MEHPHVVTMGRNGKESNLLATPEILAKAGILYHETNRGGDVTYHGPGQIVGYPIFDLRGWKKDVGAYVRAVEEALIRVLAQYGVVAGREAGMTGVWVNRAKVAAIGIHISRWVSSHGFALNHAPDLSYFGYIVPCGLSLPVTSMQALGIETTRAEVVIWRDCERFWRGVCIRLGAIWTGAVSEAISSAAVDHCCSRIRLKKREKQR
ncbi:MAG: lipoyl(octanoyl) transferase LipB [Bryobacterales bacterium]|nr:lipoyl(octanoyl) transferase LipB [Bryobacterales bacterium]